MTVTSALTSTYEHKPPLEAPKNKANSNLIGKKAATLAKLHQIRATSSELRSSVPIRRLWPGFPRYRPPGAHKTTPFMQNKANLPTPANEPNLSSNEALRQKTTPGSAKKTKPIPQNAKMNLTAYATKAYENKPPSQRYSRHPQYFLLRGGGGTGGYVDGDGSPGPGAERRAFVLRRFRGLRKVCRELPAGH